MSKSYLMPSARTLTNDETERLFLELSKNARGINELRKSIRDRLLVLLMLDAGLRISEALSLKIWQLWLGEAPCGTIEIGTDQAKLDYARSVPITSRLAAAINSAHKKIWTPLNIPSHANICGYRLPWEAPTARAIQKKLEIIGKACLGIRLHPHMLRHTYATRLMRVTDIRTVQTLLGHRHLTSTERYTHPSTEDCKAAVTALELSR